MLTHRSLLALLLLFALTPAARSAGLDPEVRKPYPLEIVLSVGDHPVLTDVFKQQLRRQLRDSLQAALGNMGEVKVTDDHRLLKQVRAEGLQKALDGGTELSEAKAHFVHVDYVNGRYEVQARQLDGLTGLASPLVRRDHTSDHQFVARTAALLVRRDLGIVGAVEKVDDRTAKVTFRGSGLGEPLDRWIKKGDVLAIARISRAGGKLQGSRVEGALLQLDEDPKEGPCKCKLWYRYDDPLAAGPGVAGYRCLKLGTGKAPLRLRLVNQQDLPHLDLAVRVGAYGFKPEDVKEQVTTNADGLVQTKNAYDQVAFVRVVSGDGGLAQIPVEIFEDYVPAFRVNLTAGAELLGDLEIRRKRWLGLVYEAVLVQAELRKQMNLLAQKDALPPLVEKAKESLRSLEADLENRTKERDALREEAKKLPRGAKLSFAEGEQRLAELQKSRDELKVYVANVEAALQKENDPNRKKALALVEQARLVEGQGEPEEAIRIYEEALKLYDDQPAVRKRLDELKLAWLPKNEQHAEARAFIYKTWPALDTPQKILEHMEEARRAVRTSVKEGDRFGVEKFVLVTVAHTAKLQEFQKKLRLQESEDDRKINQAILDLIVALQGPLTDAVDFLQKNKPAEK